MTQSLHARMHQGSRNRTGQVQAQAAFTLTTVHFGMEWSHPSSTIPCLAHFGKPTCSNLPWIPQMYPSSVSSLGYLLSCLPFFLKKLLPLNLFIFILREYVFCFRFKKSPFFLFIYYFFSSTYTLPPPTLLPGIKVKTTSTNASVLATGTEVIQTTTPAR